jgi:hypothetical protein
MRLDQSRRNWPKQHPSSRNTTSVTLKLSARVHSLPLRARIDTLPVDIMLLIFRMVWLRAADMSSALRVLSQVSQRWNNTIREMPRIIIHRTSNRLRPFPADARALSYLERTPRGADSAPTFHRLFSYIAISKGLETVSLHNLFLQTPALYTPVALSSYAAPHVIRLTLSIGTVWMAPSLESAYSDPHPYLDGAHAISNVTMVHLDVLFPRLQYLKLDSPTPLRPLTPYIPRTLRCLVLEAPPARLLQDRSTLLPWDIISALGHGLFARALRAYGVHPEIIVRGTLQEPAMWQDVLSACAVNGVVLQRVVAYEASRYTEKAGSRFSLMHDTARHADASRP